jgi:hypothetical protein
VRPLAVALLADVLKRALLSPSSARGRAGGFCLQRPGHALMAAMVLGVAGLEQCGADPQADPPGGEWREPAQGLGGTGHPVVGAAALGQPERLEAAGAHGLGFGHAGGRERLAAEANAAVALGPRQGRAVAAVPGVNVAVEIGAPHLMGGTHVADGVARRPTRSALSPLGPSAVAAAEVTDGRARRPGPAGMAGPEERAPLLGPPGRMPWPCVKDGRPYSGGGLAGRRAGATGARFEPLWAVDESAVAPLIPGLAADAVELAALGH